MTAKELSAFLYFKGFTNFEAVDRGSHFEITLDLGRWDSDSTGAAWTRTMNKVLAGISVGAHVKTKRVEAFRPY